MPRAPYTILVLYCLDPQRSRLAFLRGLTFFLKEHAPEHNYVYHNARYDSPTAIAKTDFDAIILDVTFLALRWNTESEFARILKDYAFVKASRAVKIALPQDEYDCNEILDNWLTDWQIDTLFSVISSHHEILYPKYHRIGQIELGYTGYVPEQLIDTVTPAFGDRPIDIGYRAQKLPAYFGRLGLNKWQIGEKIAAISAKYGLKTDIVIGPHGTLYGQEWYNFIANCKFTLGANSGSSLLDPRGEIQRAIRSYESEHGQREFSELESLFFPGQDGLHNFTALSPRVIEAALLRSCQILVKGEYSGIVKPWVHYIPLEPDGSNFEAIVDFMRDGQKVERMIEDCRSEILGRPELRFASKARRILECIDQNPRTMAASLRQKRLPGKFFYDRRKKLEFRSRGPFTQLQFIALRLINKLGWTI